MVPFEVKVVPFEAEMVPFEVKVVPFTGHALKYHLAHQLFSKKVISWNFQIFPYKKGEDFFAEQKFLS